MTRNARWRGLSLHRAHEKDEEEKLGKVGLREIESSHAIERKIFLPSAHTCTCTCAREIERREGVTGMEEENRKMDTSLAEQKKFHAQDKFYRMKEILPQKRRGGDRIRGKQGG